MDYSNKDLNIRPKSDCLSGVGYNTCKDVGFQAKELIAALSPEIAFNLRNDLNSRLEMMPFVP